MIDSLLIAVHAFVSRVLMSFLIDETLLQDDQLKHTYSSYVRIRDVALKTCQRRWTIGRSGERGSGISVLAAWHDDDDKKDHTFPKGSITLKAKVSAQLEFKLIYFGAIVHHLSHYAMATSQFIFVYRVSMLKSLVTNNIQWYLLLYNVW